MKTFWRETKASAQWVWERYKALFSLYAGVLGTALLIAVGIVPPWALLIGFGAGFVVVSAGAFYRSRAMLRISRKLDAQQAEVTYLAKQAEAIRAEIRRRELLEAGEEAYPRKAIAALLHQWAVEDARDRKELGSLPDGSGPLMPRWSLVPSPWPQKLQNGSSEESEQRTWHIH